MLRKEEASILEGKYQPSHQMYKPNRHSWWRLANNSRIFLKGHPTCAHDDIGGYWYFPTEKEHSHPMHISSTIAYALGRAA